MSKEHPGAPSLAEIHLFPIAGAVVMELLHTKRNELELLFAPFLIVAFRLFIAQSQIPRWAAKSGQIGAAKACAASVSLNQGAAFVLLLMEFAVVMTGSTVRSREYPAMLGVGAVAGAFYVLYVLIRLLSRRFYFKAVALASEDEAPAINHS